MAKGQYVSPGRYRDPKTGKVYNSTTGELPSSKSKTDTSKSKGDTSKTGTTTTTTPATKDIPISGPTGGSLSGLVLPDASGVSPDVKKYLDDGSFFADLFSQNVTPRTIGLTPEQEAQITKTQSDMMGPEVSNPAVEEGLAALRAAFGAAGKPIGQEDSLLAELSRRAIEGYSPQELQAARENASQQSLLGLQSALRGSLGGAANMGIGGADAIATSLPTQFATVQALADLERQLVVDNATRKDASMKDALTFGDTIQKRRFGEVMDASGNLFTGGLQAQDSDRQYRLDRFRNLSDSVLNFSNQALDTQKLNNDSLNSFELSRLGAFTGGLEYGDAANTNKELLNLQKKNITGGSGSGRSNSNSGGSKGATPTVTASKWNDSGSGSTSTGTTTTPGGTMKRSAFSTSRY